jgi:hypothetical protein
MPTATTPLLDHYAAGIVKSANQPKTMSLVAAVLEFPEAARREV